MKIAPHGLAIVLTFVLTAKLSAQDATNSPAASSGAAISAKISAAEATNYYDKEMTVTGKVAQVTVRPTVTFINLDKPFPKSPFAVVIVHKHSQFYGAANALKGKTIEVKGKIKEYNGKPEIMLDSTNQLTVIGVTNLELFLQPKIPAAKMPTNVPPPSVQATNFPEIM